jgi:hypothetical protein
MRYVIDDTNVIPDYIRNMPREQLRAEIRAYEEEAKREKQLRLQAQQAKTEKSKPHPQNA